jgi:ATP/maltotriose-dependent transcriptional regulator MalT
LACLHEALSAGSRLILLAAPAGSGKTTLLAAWARDEFAAEAGNGELGGQE